MINVKEKLLFVALIFVITLGCKWKLINDFASDLPYMDPWGAEAYVTLIPWVEDKLNLWDNFCSPHNEHIIGWTRLWSLMIFSISGQWDNEISTTFNSIVHAFSFAILVLVFRHYLVGPGIWLLPLILCSISYSNLSWENTLGCFQIAFYFSQIVAILFIFFSSYLKCPKKLTLSIIISIIGIPTMASNIFPILAVILTNIVFLKKEFSYNNIFVVRFISYTLLLFLSLFLYQNVEHHKDFRVSSFTEIFLMLPIGFSLFFTKNILLSFILAIILNLPIFLFFTNLIFKEKKFNRSNFTLCAFVTYSIISVLVLLISRYELAESSRYFDTYFLLIISNCICLISLWITLRKKKSLVQNLAIWVWFIIVLFVLQRSDIETIKAMDNKWLSQENLLRNYKLTGEESIIDENAKNLPYPDKEMILNVMNHEMFSDYLPTSIRSPIIYRKDIPYSQQFDKIKDGQNENSKYYFLTNENRNVLISDVIYPEPDIDFIRMTYQGSTNLNGNSISLITNDEVEIHLNNKTLRDTGWQTSHFKIPSDCIYFYVVIRCEEVNSWIAFKDIYEVKFYNWLTRQIRKTGSSIAFFAFCILLIFIGKKLSKDYSTIIR